MSAGAATTTELPSSAGLLEAVSSDLSDRDLRGDGQDWNPAALAVEQPVDQVQVPRTARARADFQINSQRCIGSGSEGGRLLVPRVHPGNVTASAQSVGQTVETITDNAVDALDANLMQRIGNEISNFSVHHEFSLSRDAAALMLLLHKSGGSGYE
jgi:hypothetical protein